MNPYVPDVRFYVTDTGSEPVRNWLKELPAGERRAIGEDIDLARSRLKQLGDH
jgi:hypothetical protein